MTADPLNREVFDEALADAAAVYAQTEDLDRDSLLRLSELFGANLLQSALDIVDSCAVKRLVAANSKRTVWQGLDSYLRPRDLTEIPVNSSLWQAVVHRFRKINPNATGFLHLRKGVFTTTGKRDAVDG